MKTIALIFAIALLLAIAADGQETQSYLILHSLYVFEYQDNLPYETLRPMRWDNELGFSELTETPHYLYTIVDFANHQHGYVLQDRTSGDCFLLMM